MLTGLEPRVWSSQALGVLWFWGSASWLMWVVQDFQVFWSRTNYMLHGLLVLGFLRFRVQTP